MHKTEFEKALTLSHVPRWAIVDTLKEQTVSDHTYRVSVFALELTYKIHHAFTMVNIDIGRLLTIALYHDLEEGVTGDMPTPFKREMEKKHNVIWPGKDNKPDGIEGAVVNMADAIEGLTFLLRYGIVKEGRVMDGMKHHVDQARVRLINEAIKTYMHNMPGMDKEKLTGNMFNVISDIVEGVINVGFAYE